MKNKFKITVVLTAIVFSLNFVKAQTFEYNEQTFTAGEFNLPPLKVVIDSVLKRNAMLKFRKSHINVKESTLASERIYWTRNIGIQADSRYGTLNNFSNSDDGVANTAFSTLSTQYNYSIGFYIKFPVFDMLNRKNQVRLAKFEVDEAKNMAEFQEDEIRQTIIKLYQDLILKQKLLLIRSKGLSDGKINMQMIEKEFRNGIVPVAEFIRITSITSNLEVDYETAKAEFTTAKQVLEDMAGFVFNVKDSK